jgi:1-acyl-sn-glycerol-3-phosphate acyltransferase
MLVRSEPHAVASARPDAISDARASARRAMGLLAASIFPADRAHPAVTFVAELEEAAVNRVRREALAVRLRHHGPVTVELRYVADPAADALIATLADLAAHDVHVATTPIGDTRSAIDALRVRDARHVATPSPGVVSAPVDAAMRGAEPERPVAATVASASAAPPVRAGEAALRVAPAPTPLRPPPVEDTTGPDPFGLDPAFRALTIPIFRFMFEQYWRISVSGLEHVPTSGAALVVANHSGAVPADAFMLAAALELRHPAHRPLRVLFDKFVDALPWIGDLYRRLGAVTASLPNAERLLRRGELVGLFPEGIAGVEKRCTERYRLRPFKTGTARLSIRTGSPIVPVAIVGAEEAYPVVARLYRAGRLVGLPWIPVTPLFPVCGLAGALPLPTKWSMHFGEPIEPPRADGRSEDVRVAELTSRVRASIETSLHALLAKRNGIFL